MNSTVCQSNQTSFTKHNIMTGNMLGQFLQNPMHAGTAIHYEGDSYYLVRLNLFPQTWFYMSKNQESQVGYTIFSKRREDADGDTILQNPIGRAVLQHHYIEIIIPLLRKNLFLEIFPTNNS